MATTIVFTPQWRRLGIVASWWRRTTPGARHDGTFRRRNRVRPYTTAMTPERAAADATIVRCPGAMDGQRLFATPAEEIALALRPDPPSRQGLHWIDPGFGALYILGNAANGLVKIGAAGQIRKRFTAMNAASPVELRLLHFVHLVGVPVAKVVETDIHAGLLEHRRRGEWFEIAPDVAAEAIADAVIRARFQFWTEAERRSVGSTAARYHVHRMRSAA